MPQQKRLIRRCSDRQGDNEARTPPRLTLHPDIALMEQDDLLNDGQSHTASVILAAAGTVGLEESFEDPLLILWRDPNARV